MGPDGTIRYLTMSAHMIAPGLSPRRHSPQRVRGNVLEKPSWVPAKGGASQLRPLRPPSPEKLEYLQRLERRGAVFRRAVQGLNLREGKSRSLPSLGGGTSGGSLESEIPTRRSRKPRIWEKEGKAPSDAEASVRCKALLEASLAEQRRLSLLAEQQMHFFDLLNSPKNKKRLQGLPVLEDSDDEDAPLFAQRQPTNLPPPPASAPRGGSVVTAQL